MPYQFCSRFTRIFITVFLIIFSTAALTDDAYEENDDRLSAYSLTVYQGLKLSNISGLAESFDDDWYQIEVTDQFNKLTVEISYNSAVSILDLRLYNSTGSPIAVSFTGSGRETIIEDSLPAGTYYVYVNTYTGAGGLIVGAQYDMYWNDSRPDANFNPDNFEPNQSAADATPWLTPDFFLSQINGSPTTATDFDFYEIAVPSGQTVLSVNMYHIHAEGNLDFAIYDDTATFIAGAQATSFSDDEFLEFDVGSPGTYYIGVYTSGIDFDSNPLYTGQLYNMLWSVAAPPTDDNYEPNNTPGDAFDLSAYENVVLTSIDGAGISNDVDYYELTFPSVPSPFQIQVNLSHSHAEGDLEMNLRDTSGNLIASSTSSTDNEAFIVDINFPVTYYIEVESFSYTGQSYNLIWSMDISEDNYEENDDSSNAYDLSASEDTPLSSIDGSGVSNDQDWYEINVTSGNTEVRIDLTFSSAVSDLDLELYDASGNQIAYSWYGIDEESINVDVINPGIYYILVDTYGNYVGANYDMTWRTSSGVVLTGDDGYEVNNDLASAYDLTSNSNTPLSDIDGPGASFDEDWYKIAVSSDALRVQADLLFTHADSDLDFELYDASGNLVITSNSSTDNESIDFTVSAAGDYYLRVITFTDDSNQYSGAQYELNWIAVSPDDAQAATTTDTVSDTNKGILSGIGDIASSASSGGGGGGSLNGLLLIPFMLMGLLRRGSSLFRG